MTEKTRCFVYGEEVTVIDGYCQVDCSIEECTLNFDNAPDDVRKKLKKTGEAKKELVESRSVTKDETLLEALHGEK